MPGLFAELYRSSLCHMVQKLQAFMTVANLGKQTLPKILFVPFKVTDLGQNFARSLRMYGLNKSGQCSLRTILEKGKLLRKIYKFEDLNQPSKYGLRKLREPDLCKDLCVNDAEMSGVPRTNPPFKLIRKKDL